MCLDLAGPNQPDLNTKDGYPILVGDLDGQGRDWRQVVPLLPEQFAGEVNRLDLHGFEVWEFSALLVGAAGAVVDVEKKARHETPFPDKESTSGLQSPAPVEYACD